MRSEQQLIDLAVTRPEVFGELYDIHYPGVFGYIYRLTGDYTLAGDITSETFLKAFVHLRSFKWKGISISSWFFRIAVNELNQYFRKRSYSPERLMDLVAADPVQWGQAFTRDGNDTISGIDRAAEFHWVRQLVLSLPTKYRQVIALRYFEELPVRDIADILGKKEGTVKSLLSRGLDKLKKKIDPVATNP